MTKRNIGSMLIGQLTASELREEGSNPAAVANWLVAEAEAHDPDFRITSEENLLLIEEVRCYAFT